MSGNRLLAVWGLLAVASATHAAGVGDDLREAKRQFLDAYKDDYGYDGRIDDLWAKEVGPRLPSDEHYLDFTGSSLYWNSQVAASVKELESAAYGNPHSTNPSSLRTERLVEGLRLQLLRFLDADPAEYELVWTRSGTGALHILGETFPWSPSSRFAYLVTNHNSVLGIREFARQAGADFSAVSEDELEAWLAAGASGGGDGGGDGASSLPPILCKGADDEGMASVAATAEPTATTAATTSGGQRQLRVQRPSHGPALGLDVGARGGPAAAGAAGAADDGADAEEEPPVSLFAFPAYDNFAGVMYPLSWVRAIQAKSTDRHKWRVLLDAAAFLPAHPLNLTHTPADFVCISFYKLWGFPTGVGALVARRDSLLEARKLYWGGGSVFLATATLDWKHYRPAGAERFEDGTLPFLNILSLQQGLQVYQNLGGQAAIERHTSALRAWLYDRLAALRHSNGAPLLRIFGRHHWPSSYAVQGSTFNFQILKPSGEAFSYRRAATALAEAGFHMRCGCTCNPGACYGYLGVRDAEVAAAAEAARGNFSDWEWVWVWRTADEAAGTPTGGGSTAPYNHTRTATEVKGEDGVRRLVRLPLGSLRASLGYMSRFEDAYALLAFLRDTYTDRPTDPPLAPRASGGAAGGSGAQGSSRRRRLRWDAPELQGPGWC